MAILQATKSANQSYIFITNNIQILTYTIIIENTSATLASNVIVTDIIPYGACYQTGTFAINGVVSDNVDPSAGINIGNVNPNSTVILTFDVIIDPENPPALLQNYATITYIDCGNSGQSDSIYTNVVQTPIISICVEVLKNVSKCSVQLNDILNYRLIINNNSTVALQNATLFDSIPNELSIIPDSIFINGVRSSFADFSQGIALGTIPASKIIIILFQAIVDCLPCSTDIQNQAYLTFEYMFEVDNAIYSSSGTATSNLVSTKAGPESFKQLILDSTLQLPCKRNNDFEIIDSFIEIDILRQEVIDTMKGMSCEGEILTGRKLIIDGTLNERIEYIELCSDQSVNVAEYSIPFNTFIVLPQNCNLYDNITIESTIENFDIKVVGCGSVYQNVALLLKVIY